MRILQTPRILFALLAILCGGSRAGAAELILIHPGAPGSLYDISAVEFARRVNDHLPAGDRLIVRSEPAGGDGPRLLGALRDRRAALVLVSSAMLDVSPRFAIFEMPYLIRGRDQIGAIRPALLNRFLQPAAEARGLRILGLWENGFRHMANDARPVTQPGDLRGLGIALTGNGWRERLFAAFGSEPIPMAPLEIANTLRDHRADGREGPLNEMAASGIIGVQRHLTLSDHLYSPAFLIAHRASFAGLPQPVRYVLAAEAVAIEPWIQEQAIALESELIDRLDRQMTVSHANVAAFKAAGQKLYGEFVRAVPEGVAMLDALQSSAVATGATQYPR